MPVSEMVPNLPEPFLSFTLEVHRFPLSGSMGQASYHRLRSGSPSSRRRPSGPLPCPLPPLTPGMDFSSGGNVSGSRATGGVGAAGALRARLCQNQEVTPASQGGARPLEGPCPRAPQTSQRCQSSCPHSHGPVHSYLSSLSLTQIPETGSHLPGISDPAPHRERSCSCTHRHTHANMRTPNMHTHVCTYPHTRAFPPQSCLCHPTGDGAASLLP